jgi:hypothetical protein
MRGDTPGKEGRDREMALEVLKTDCEVMRGEPARL